MEIIYYMIGFCLINLFWIVPFSIIAALIANGIINTISLFVFFCMAKRKNTIPLTRISAIKILMHWRHFFEMCFHEQKYSKYHPNIIMILVYGVVHLVLSCTGVRYASTHKTAFTKTILLCRHDCWRLYWLRYGQCALASFLLLPMWLPLSG